MKKFHNLSLILMIFTLVLVAAGGLVTSTGSGLSVPDWPLSFGKLFPAMVGGVQYEHTHRVIAGVVLLLTMGLAWIARRDVPGFLKLLAWLGLALVLLQALLGGLTVLLLLPIPVSVLHACLGQSFFALTVAMWWLSGRADISNAAPSADPLSAGADAQRWAGRIALTILLIQLFLGAYVRHSGGRAIVEHIGGAFAVTAAVAVLAILTRVIYAADRQLRNASMILLALLAAQIALGYGSFVWTVLRPVGVNRPLDQVLITTAHQTTGALILAFSMVLTLASETTRTARRSQKK
jgi:cytochrome c oxidase assembly protein subunit 15